MALIAFNLKRDIDTRTTWALFWRTTEDEWPFLYWMNIAGGVGLFLLFGAVLVGLVDWL